MSTTYADATEFIIRQQFHNDGNIITSRIGDRQLIVMNSDIIVTGIIQTILSIVKLWEDDSEWFLDKMCTFFGLPSEAVIIRVREKLYTMVEATPQTVNPEEILTKKSDQIPKELFFDNEEKYEEKMLFYLSTISTIVTILREEVLKQLIAVIFKEYPPAKAFPDQLEEALTLEESLLTNLAVLQRYAGLMHIDLPPGLVRKEMAASLVRIIKKIEKMKTNSKITD